MTRPGGMSFSNSICWIGRAASTILDAFPACRFRLKSSLSIHLLATTLAFAKYSSGSSISFSRASPKNSSLLAIQSLRVKTHYINIRQVANNLYSFR